jgi:hypothetical protein
MRFDRRAAARLPTEGNSNHFELQQIEFGVPSSAFASSSTRATHFLDSWTVGPTCAVHRRSIKSTRDLACFCHRYVGQTPFKFWSGIPNL